MLCNAPHCRAWSLLMNTNGMQQLQGKKAAWNTTFIIFRRPRSQPSEKQSPVFLLTPLLPDQIHFLAVMLPLLGYLFRFFCTCATIKWNIYRASQWSHYGKPLLLLLAFFLRISLKNLLLWSSFTTEQSEGNPFSRKHRNRGCTLYEQTFSPPVIDSCTSYAGQNPVIAYCSIWHLQTNPQASHTKQPTASLDVQWHTFPHGLQHLSKGA